jgi:hypothetical protein
MGGEMNSELERQQAMEAGLPAKPAAAAAEGGGADDNLPSKPKADPDRISWPMAAVGLVLARTGSR